MHQRDKKLKLKIPELVLQKETNLKTTHLFLTSQY